MRVDQEGFKEKYPGQYPTGLFPSAEGAPTERILSASYHGIVLPGDMIVGS